MHRYPPAKAVALNCRGWKVCSKHTTGSSRLLQFYLRLQPLEYTT